MDRIVKGIWIPLEIWQDNDLSWNEKILLMEIDSFTSKGKDCYISNDYIANLLGVSSRSARAYLAHLIDRNLVKVTSFDGRIRMIESNLISFQAEWKEISRQSGEEFPHTYINKPKHINTTTLSMERGGRWKKPTLEEIRQYCQERNNSVDPEQFFNFYESNGWRVGKNPMRNWKAAIHTWENREKEIPARKREAPRRESVTAHNLRVIDQMYGTNYYEQAMGRAQADEQ